MGFQSKIYPVNFLNFDFSHIINTPAFGSPAGRARVSAACLCFAKLNETLVFLSSRLSFEHMECGISFFTALQTQIQSYNNPNNNTGIVLHDVM